LQAHCQSPTSHGYKQSFVKELAKSAHVAKGIFAIAQKNKINLCFVDTVVQLDSHEKES
jgi:hypothetical protein